MRVALVYDRLNKFGGAERVLLALHEIWPDAPLFTSVFDEKLAPWAKVFDVRTSFIQNTPLPKNKHEMYPFLMGLAFESFNFDEFDLVISITHEFAKAIITKPKTLHICYCLTPTGYLWNNYANYFVNKPAWFRAVTRPLVSFLRRYDRIVAERPDQYIAISETVSERINEYYRRKSSVIYPPVSMEKKVPMRAAPGENFFLIVSRLVPNKRLDIAIDAFNETGQGLKIIGAGAEEARLKRTARRNIEFLGSLTDEARNDYYETCQAVVIPGEEDFNIVAVEAQSYGKPVIAYKKGGVTETVVDGKTGLFFDQQTAKCLAKVLKSFNRLDFSTQDCINNARRFSAKRFHDEFRHSVESSWDNWQRTQV